MCCISVSSYMQSAMPSSCFELCGMLIYSCYGSICRYACHQYICLSTKSSVGKAVPTIQMVDHFIILLRYTDCICEFSFAVLEKFQWIKYQGKYLHVNVLSCLVFQLVWLRPLCKVKWGVFGSTEYKLLTSVDSILLILVFGTTGLTTEDKTIVNA